MYPPEIPLTEDDIARLVRRFYARAMEDEFLRPIFEAAISDWESHHRVVEDFWSRTLLGTGRYRGHPYVVHARLPLRPEHFDRWLAHFRSAADESLPAGAARRAVARAEQMAASFRAGMFTFDHPVHPCRARRA